MEYPKGRDRKRILVCLRWTVIIVTSYLILFGQGRVVDFHLGHVFIVTYILSNLVLMFFPAPWFSRQGFSYSLILFDTGLVSLGMYLSERVTTDFYMVFFLILIFASMSRSFRLLMAVSGVTAVLYGVLLYSWGLLASEEASSYALRVPFIFIMATFYGYLVQLFKKESQKQLAISEDKYRGLFENANDGIVILDCPSMKIINVNRKVEELTGFAKAEMLRRDGGQLFRLEDRREAEAHFAQVEKEGEARTETLALARKDGGFLEIDLSSKRIDLGEESFVQMIFRDLSAQRLLERKIRESKRNLQAIFDGIRDPLSLQSLDYEILRVNRAVVEAYHSDYRSMIGRRCFEAYFGRECPCEGCPLKVTFRTRQPATTLMKLPQEERTLRIFSYPIFDEKGEVTSAIEHVHDVTDEQRLQETLIRSEKLAGIGILASGIAHEINNPLSGIVGMAEIAMEEDDLPTLREHLGDILRCSHRISDIVKGLSSYSRSARKDEKTLIDIPELLERALQVAQATVKSRAVEIVRHFQPVEGVTANSGEIQLVFNHLLINAYQAMNGRGGRLILSTRPLKEGVEVKIADNGVGIPSRDLPHIFDPFFTTKKFGEGKGLGLNIAYRIVAKYEGTLDVESTEGVGTTFTVRLPRGRDENEQEDSGGGGRRSGAKVTEAHAQQVGV